jgi:choline dehydrogenase-like flavoprotein
MSKVAIVGSGASGVHFALSAVEKGHDVVMLDVGNHKPAPLNPDDTFTALKENLPDPVEYFLGNNFEGVIYPDFSAEYYGFPPSKNYVFSTPKSFVVRARHFHPLFSFAQGGLAEVWTAGVYPFNDYELSDFPFSYESVEPYYDLIARRIGITGTNDDLAQFMPFHKFIQDPLDLDQHSRHLLLKYEKNKKSFNDTYNCYLGRSRVATLSKQKGTRQGCTYTGRCLWGCPSEALYTPSITLAECKRFPNFTYLPNIYVTHFGFDSNRRITTLIAESTTDSSIQEFSVDKLVLAAGTLSTSRIYLESIWRATGDRIKLHGLMDNRQILIPFINMNMLGEPNNPRSYQYHQLAMGIVNGTPREYIHCQITTLKTAIAHPIIQRLPFDLKSSTGLFRNFRSALGLVNVNLQDTRRMDNFVTLDVDPKTETARLNLEYYPSPEEKGLLRNTIKKVKKMLLKLGCFVPPGMTYVRPIGASVHYSGTIPMSLNQKPHSTSQLCQSSEFSNLFIVDGSVLPFLPAKNTTFTLMANAARVADLAF